MNDITLGDPSDLVAEDVCTIKASGIPLGFILNENKCKAIIVNGHLEKPTLQQFILHTLTSSTLLGAPLTQGPAINDCLQKCCSNLERAISRLILITLHEAFVLLRASFGAPMLQHTLRTLPCYEHELLSHFDSLLRSVLSKLCNVSLTNDQ